ncbi:MAG: lipo-like protein [Gammaproteobacteria bacterium]|jgi:hypothetical protein|nr:lipo-like protein [Gammaproteobacteria bacterium]HJN96453.1 YiiX/YebB-like N1pC/P60 family cysteine hydrolase [Gammaproteobacteria bacterium]|tara:strand:- start:14120 stop:14896 length:777 start_codon:yes stop_codon:yes gene_type:complete
MITTINRAIGTRLARFLSKTLPGYQRIDTVSIEKVACVLQTGDILLVEGNTRISTAIKYLTQSSWSHACLFVGQSDADCAEPTLVEADLKHGVRLVSLQHYADLNLRICRPVRLSDGDTQSLVEFARSKLGHKYDLKNVVDLLRYLIQKPAVPLRYRRAMISFGSGEPTMAICSTLIAESFQSIDYPILPRRNGEQGRNGEVPQFYRRHFTHFTPRDFDLSPYFKVIKPTIDEDFDYRDLQWQGSGESEKENGVEVTK